MKRVLVIAGVAAGVAAAAAATMLALVDRAPTPQRADVVAVDPHGAEIDAIRTLLVGRTQPAPSQGGVLLQGRLVKGAMPLEATDGTVLTDEDCAADVMGISNCLNRIRLADGREIAVRHPHDMSEVPCFAPGEPVRVVPA